VASNFSIATGVFGRFYFDLAAASSASLVAVSISGLAFRRLVIRPKWLGPVSYESGFIALLIFLLMVTYLGTFLPGWDRAGAVVGAHADASDLPAADPAHQASAPGAEPGDGVLEARHVQQDSAAGGRRRFRTGYRQGHHELVSLQAFRASSADAAANIVRPTIPAKF
jgi:hypothetical protein